MTLPRDEWGGLLGFRELWWHIQQALMVMRLNRAIREAER